MTTPRAEQKTPDEEKLVKEIAGLLDDLLVLPLNDAKTVVENKDTIERACDLAHSLKKHGSSDLGLKFWTITHKTPLNSDTQDLLLLLNRVLPLFKGRFIVPDRFTGDHCQRALLLRELGEPRLAIDYLDFFDQRDEEFSLLLPHAAQKKDWEFVKYLLDKYHAIINIEASIVDNVAMKGGDDDEAKEKMSAKTLFYSARARNKNITKYLLLLGADRNFLDYQYRYFSLAQRAIDFVDSCRQELDRSEDFAVMKSVIFENRNSSTFLFQEFKINLRKTAPINPSDDFITDLKVRGLDDMTVHFSAPLRQKILSFLMDPDVEGIPEPVLLAWRTGRLAAREVETGIPKIAALAIREYRDNFKGSMTPAISKDKHRLTCQILDKKLGSDIGYTYKNLIRFSFGFMARKEISLTEGNIQNLLSLMETAIKNLVDSAAEKAKLDYKNVPVTLLNKTYHAVQLLLVSVFSAKEYSGLWLQKDVMEQCAVKLAGCLNALPSNFYEYDMPDRMTMLRDAIKKHMVPVLEEAVLKQTSSEEDRLSTRLQA